MSSSVSKSSAGSSYNPAPLTTHYEFMGPPGAVGISVAVTFFSYFFAFGCSEQGCPPTPLGAFVQHGLQRFSTLQGWLDLFDAQAALVYAIWYLYTVICWIILPGEWMQGATLRNGSTLGYKMNGIRIPQQLTRMEQI